MFFTEKNRLLIKITIHVLIWVFLFSFPYLLTNTESLDLIRLIKYTWVPTLFSAVIFYFNYAYLIKRFLFAKKITLFVSINFGLIVVLIFLHLEIREFLNMISEIKPNLVPVRPIQLFIYKDVISMLIPIIAAIATKTTERWTNLENEKQGREKEILNSELQLLKYQLQPHFFFNSLNTIYALIERSPSVAQETVHSLSKLMRYMLYDTDAGKVSLAEEIEFMKQYITLMKLRISEKTQIHMNFPAITGEFKLIPLLFISLVENAFKHGISAHQQSELFFDLTVDKNTIRFSAKNTNFPKTGDDKSGSGIGLVNLKKRLELTYRGKHKFTTSSDGNIFTSVLEIKID
jgi:sensor histidine kinase YesM